MTDYTPSPEAVEALATAVRYAPYSEEGSTARDLLAYLHAHPDLARTVAAELQPGLDVERYDALRAAAEALSDHVWEAGNGRGAAKRLVVRKSDLTALRHALWPYRALTPEPTE